MGLHKHAQQNDVEGIASEMEVGEPLAWLELPHNHDVMHMQGGADIHETNTQGRTALMVGAWRGNKEVRNVMGSFWC